MILSKTSEYAIRVMTYIAVQNKKLISAKSLSEDLSIPYKYLGQLLRRLSGAGFLEAAKGKHGGYRLNKDAGQIYLYQIIDRLEGMETYQGCFLGFPKCDAENPCALHTLWEKPREALLEMLFKTSIEDLVTNGMKRF
jgi:Rrf2 family protein